MASARKTVIPRMTATRPRDRASGEIRTRWAGVLPGAEIVVTVGLLQDRASLLTRRGDGEVSDLPARRGGWLTVARPCWTPTSFLGAVTHVGWYGQGDRRSTARRG